MNSMDGCVYVIGCDENGTVKIGRTRELKSRLAAIQRMSPVKLRVLWSTADDGKLEAKLHKVFSARRIHGEWFDFSDLDPVTVIRSAIKERWSDDRTRPISESTPQAVEVRQGTRRRSPDSREPRITTLRGGGAPGWELG